MKPILLIADTVGMLEFDTVKEAVDYAEQVEQDPEFHIYSLFSRGERRGIEWKLATDTATNLRENRKEEEKKRKGTWTTREVDIALEHLGKGVPISDIAKGLKRSYNAVYSKLLALGAIKK
jgi:DNA-binding NarL/FixJ family response regulator